MNPGYSHETLERRIADQFPALFITLVSVLVGLALADLVSEARSRMVFWPIDLNTLRTWFEFSTNAFSALVSWIMYSHIAVARRHVPSLADAFIAFTLPLALLFGNSFVGIGAIWPWFYFASSFLAFSLLTTVWLEHVLRLEHELASFKRIFRPTGYISVFALGIPFYAAVGWADQHHYLSPWLEVVCAATGTPSALLVGHMFQRDWRDAIKTVRVAKTQ